MTREELNKKIKEIEKVYDKRYLAAMRDWYAYRQGCRGKNKVVVKPAPEESEFKRLALLAVDHARKEYLMERFPVRVGDMVEVCFGRKSCSGHFYETTHYIRVESISVSGVEHPVLKFGGKWFRADGQPFYRQQKKLVSQNDIRRYGPNIKNLKPIINNEESED
jgi:hypothetical protein